MKYIIILGLLHSSVFLFGQGDIYGTWKAIDDVDGQPSSHIEIYEQDGQLHGKITKILKDADPDVLCDLCEGDKKNQPVLGLEIIWNMDRKGKNTFKGGRILDPENGKTYKCRIKLVNDVLEVRGYIGIPALGRTQKWYPVD